MIFFFLNSITMESGGYSPRSPFKFSLQQLSVHFLWFTSLLPSTCIMWCPSRFNSGSIALFLYVNDIPSSSKYFSFVLFADDTNILLSYPNLNTLTHYIQYGTNQSNQSANKLSLNVSKTNYIHFSKKKHNTPQAPTIQGVPIKTLP